MIRRWAGNSKPLSDSGARRARFLSPARPKREDASAAAWASTGANRRGASGSGQQSGPGPATAADGGSDAGGWRLGRMAMAPRLAATGSTHHKKRRACATARRQGSADVMERLLIRKIDPAYPEAARRANLQA